MDQPAPPPQPKRDEDLRTLYESIDKDFYFDQTQSRNPLRRWFHLNRYRIANALVKSKYSAGKKIVDFGCGSCDWNTDQLSVFGVDFNPEFLKLAKQKNRLSDYIVGDTRETGLPAESFDIATAFEYLEHMTDYERVIQEGQRVLVPGGYFIISVPYDVVWSLWRPLFFLQVMFQGYILQNEYYKNRCGHVNNFSAETIADAFRRHGFTIDLLFDMRKFTIFLCAQKSPARAAAPPAFSAASVPTGTYGDLTVILPTLNEAKNIRNICAFLLSRYPVCKVIVSDDGSTDGTKEAVLEMKEQNLIFLDRAPEPVHGLTASVLDAVERVRTDYFVVIDADGQHPAEKIGEVVNILRGGSRLVIASRIAVEKEWGFFRKALSYLGTALGKTCLLVRGKNYLSYDILGGFFGCKTKFWKKCNSRNFKNTRFRTRGYKVLFDFLKYAPARLKIEEAYYRFETRRAGVTKINLKIYLEYLKSCFLP